MPFRIRQFLKVSALFLAGSILTALPMTSALFLAGSILTSLPIAIRGFVPSTFRSHKVPSTQKINKAPTRIHKAPKPPPHHRPHKAASTQLHYTMPDVTNMKATEMRQELESYGIHTHTFFDKREIEQALIEARHNYEQTLNDVMSSTRPKEKKVAAKPKTVDCDRDRDRHGAERVYSSDANNQPRSGRRRPPPKQQQQQQQRRRRGYQAQPNPIGFDSANFNEIPNAQGARDIGGRSRRSSPGNDWFEEDPLFEHEKQARHFQTDGHDHFHRDQQQQQQHQHQQQHHNYDEYEEYEVGGRHRKRVTYDDPAKEMKYQAALQYAHSMKIEDIQRELNSRGVSTKNCIIIKDFCIEYAKAIADKRQKGVNDDEAFGDDSDYDPDYRDVVMQKYDPSMWC